MIKEERTRREGKKNACDGTVLMSSDEAGKPKNAKKKHDRANKRIAWN